MAKLSIPQALTAQLQQDGILENQVRSSRKEEVISFLVEEPGGFGYAVTYQKHIVKDGVEQWQKIFDGREHGND